MTDAEKDVADVFTLNSEMPLRRERVNIWRINWKSKSENIKSMAQELGIGLNSFIYIDDNPIECAEVQENCPEVLTLQLPDNADEIPNFLRHVWEFDHIQKTEEDKKRSVFYQEHSRREQERQKYSSLADFINSLNLRVEISKMTPEQISRVSQLTQRTNQFNLSSIRRQGHEIRKLQESSEYECLVVKACDRFGDYGLVGTMIIKMTDEVAQVDTFLLSCRALGRGIEHQMLVAIGNKAYQRAKTDIDIVYIPTDRNKPIRDFLYSVGTEYIVHNEDTIQFRFPCEYL
ncbi:MAG: non-ribosomal peptide synthetase, partial [Promethearchaeota archaeon]